MVEELLPNLFRIEIPLPKSPLKYLNSYVIKDSTRNMIIDTGLNRKECLEAMEAGLREIDVDLKNTDFFITHLHADHFGLVAELVTEGAKIYFNRPDTEIIEAKGSWETMLNYAGLNGFPREVLQTALKNHPGYKFGSEWIPELSILSDDDTIDIGDYTFQCVETPGHTRGHTCLYESARKVLLSGDHILIDITPNIQCWTDDDNPLAKYLTSLDKVYDLDVDLVLPGHRRLFKDHRKRINELKDHHRRRADEVLSILDSGPRHAFQVASKMTWDITYESWEAFPLMQKWFATGEAIAHLRYIEDLGHVSRTIESGITLFSLNGHERP
jgi:glyoxylase-like metal-dependent hydrolase (beta-lactamase superfamily II)